MSTFTDFADGTSNILGPRSMTAEELGDSLAQLVWESFSDFISDGDAAELVTELGSPDPDDLPGDRIAEEMLIFLMWAHTRGVQLAFVGSENQDLVRLALDSMHRAVFEDMVDNGTPRAQIPIFEQRVSARYTDYSAAAQVSDTEVGARAFENVTGESPWSEERIRTCAERAIHVASPLRDFLSDVSLEA
jgi:hypothetical protein